MNRFRVLLIRLTENLYFFAYHESGVETQAEVTNDSLRFVLVLVEELLGTAKRYLVDVLIHLFGSHTYAVITHRQRLFIFINRYAYA